jgi:hypothetical protein
VDVFNKERKTLYAEATSKIYSRNEVSICETVKQVNEIHTHPLKTATNIARNSP